MLLFYNLGIRIYYLCVWITAPFNQKTYLWKQGRSSQQVAQEKESIWVHCASLGEWEQAKPILERLRQVRATTSIVVTFFSPSGFVRGNISPITDKVYYLPLDTAANAQAFIRTIRPTYVLFIKYEYWYHFYKELNRLNIPLYVVAGIFRPEQVFFRHYGGFFRKLLGYVRYFFVQDERSKELLQQIGIKNVLVSGDTRFDQVWNNKRLAKSLPLIEKFRGTSKVFIAGSTWPPDERLIVRLIHGYPSWKFIIVPHEPTKERIRQLKRVLSQEALLSLTYTALADPPPTLAHASVLIVDRMGLLATLYQYATVAYIGGGFGCGIHNTLEAAVFGVPVIFGPNHQHFREACALVARQGGFSIGNFKELKDTFDLLAHNQDFFTKSANNAGSYVLANVGATDKIMDHLMRTIVNS